MGAAGDRDFPADPFPQQGADGAVRNDCIYVGSATGAANAASLVSSVTITGGTFEAAKKELGQYWVLNVQNDFFAAHSDIIVKGGQYKNFDPANNTSEASDPSFVADGYKSVKNGDWYTVVKE